MVSSRQVLVERPPGVDIDVDVFDNQKVRRGKVLGQYVRDTDSSVDVGSLADAFADEWTGDITAPVAGRAVVDGSRVGVQADGLDVVVTLTPIQTLRYLGQRFVGDAEVETLTGIRRLRCLGLWRENGSPTVPGAASSTPDDGGPTSAGPASVNSASAGHGTDSTPMHVRPAGAPGDGAGASAPATSSRSSSDNGAADSQAKPVKAGGEPVGQSESHEGDPAPTPQGSPQEDEGTPVVRCRLPTDAVTAPGVEARLLLSSLPKKNVLVVPNLYIAYDRKRDTYYTVVVDTDGTKRRREISVSFSDGISRIVTDGLVVGERLATP